MPVSHILYIKHSNVHHCSFQFHVFELTRQLPRFSMYAPCRKDCPEPKSSCTFQVNERIQRVSPCNTSMSVCLPWLEVSSVPQYSFICWINDKIENILRIINLEQHCYAFKLKHHQEITLSSISGSQNFCGASQAKCHIEIGHCRLSVCHALLLVALMCSVEHWLCKWQ